MTQIVSNFRLSRPHDRKRLTLSTRQARRLALVRAGLLKPSWTGFPQNAKGIGKRSRIAANKVIERFGYLQLDTVSIAGARSHSIVLMSRLKGFDPKSIGICFLSQVYFWG